MNPRFITLEGSEGAGKSTNLEILTQTLTAQGLEIYVTREPGGTELAEEIRQLILAPRVEKVTALTEVLLMFAARAQHLEEVIKPRLDAGQIVVCDRFVDASYAYQGHGRGLGVEIIQALDDWVVGDCQPGLTIYLDLPPEVGAQRIANRAKDRVEMEQQVFFETVRQGYLERLKTNERMQLVDATKSLEEVAAQVEHITQAYVATL
jgi:dTMP kinase